LVEGKKKGKWLGRTRGDKLVFFSGNECLGNEAFGNECLGNEAFENECLGNGALGNECLAGQLVQVEIEKTSAWALQGRRCS